MADSDSPLGARAAAAAAAPDEAAAAPDEAAKAALRRRTVRSLSWSMFMQFFTSTMVQQAQIAVGLRLSGNDRALVISRMAGMQSLAAAIQFLVTPAFGRGSDVFGRRPLMQISNIVGAALRLSVVLVPSWATLSLTKVLGMNCSNAFRTGLDAALSDVFEGAELAVASSDVKSMQGVTMLVAPVIGGWLTDMNPYLPFTVSAVIGFANSVLIRLTFKETAETALSSKAAEGATSGRALIANPLGFLKLFRHGRALSMLTLSSGVQVCHCAQHHSPPPRLTGADAFCRACASLGRTASTGTLPARRRA